MIYTDGTHLITDKDPGELHAFASTIGLKREWYQDKKRPHYDLTTKRMAGKAIRAGARVRTAKEIIQILKEKEEDK